MTISKDKILKALGCCTSTGRSMCSECPVREECESSPFESVIAKYAFELVSELLHEKEALTEQRDTFREYAYKMHALVENIRVKENEGYEFSAAKYAAEMDMWRVIAAEKKALQDENKRLSADNEELYKEMSERMKEEVRIAKKYTARRIHSNLMRYTESVGECTIDNPLAETCSVVREDDIDRVINEVVEECDGEKDT